MNLPRIQVFPLSVQTELQPTLNFTFLIVDIVVVDHLDTPIDDYIRNIELN